MTALPPTKGHLHLIQFSANLAPTTVIVCTQPSEPFATERFNAIRRATDRIGNTRITEWLHREIEQNPEAPGFWKMWNDLLRYYGFRDGDYIVASETYGKRLAEEVGGKFMPYDINRELYPCKATDIRENLPRGFSDILLEFQPTLRRTITVFGAESTGKTTLSKELARKTRGHWLFEYARPYLENTVNEITDETMTDIWNGQYALQKQGQALLDKPFVIQDTDLFSTVGYWDFWKPGECPKGLRADAQRLKSDLYIITRSNIPFEPDPLRYGGDKREASDEYWIDLCRREDLNFIVLNNSSLYWRIEEAYMHAMWNFDSNAAALVNYRRQHNS